MQIKFKTSEIVKAVAILMKVWKKNSIIPACENFLIQYSDGKIRITINNTYIMCSTSVNAEVSDFSPFQIGAWDFQKIISSFNEDEIVIKSKSSKLMCSNKKIKIAVTFIDDPVYPKITPIGEKVFITTIEPESFNYFQKLSMFISDDERRPEFCTGKFIFKDNKCFLEATDAVNLIRVNMGDCEYSGRIRSIYPDMMNIIGNMQTNSPISLYHFDNCLLFEKDGYEYYGIENNVRYPDTDVFLNGFNEDWIELPTSDMTNAYKIVSPFSDDMGDKIIDILIDGIDMEIIGSDFGSSKVAKYTIELQEKCKKKISSAFKAKFFGNMFQVFGNTVYINFSKDLHGLGIKDSNVIAVMREIIKN